MVTVSWWQLVIAFLLMFGLGAYVEFVFVHVRNITNVHDGGKP